MAAFTHPAESRFRGGDYGVFYCAAMGLTAIRETVHPNFSELAMVMDDLCKQVTVARQEFDMAVTFHETWKPAAYDQGLHSRMGPSYASQTFLVIRTALRREMVLALMRLWDKSRGSVRVWRIAENLRNPSVIDALARDRAERIGLSEAVDAMRADLGEKAAEAIRLTDKYTKGGSHAAILEKLQGLRGDRLAHRRLESATVSRANATDDEIEAFYQDSAKLIHKLMSLVNATSYDPEDTAQVYRHYAKYFWAAARGEQTEGHPNHRPSTCGALKSDRF